MVKKCPRFRLRSRPPDWEAIARTDVDLVMERGDAPEVLSGLIDTLAFSKVTPSELRRAGFDASASLVRLLQISAEYLLHVQEALGEENASLNVKLREEREEKKRLGAQLRLVEMKRDSLARTNDQLGDLCNSGSRNNRVMMITEGEEEEQHGKFEFSTARELHVDRWRESSVLAEEAPAACLAAFDAAGGMVSDLVPMSAVAISLSRSQSARAAIFGLDDQEDVVASVVLDTYGGGMVHREMLGAYIDGLRKSHYAAKSALASFRPQEAVTVDEAVVEVEVRIVGATGLPETAKAGCVGVLLKPNGERLAATRAAVGQREKITWTDPGAVIPLDATTDGPAVDIEVWGGAVLLGVARAKISQILYDGIIRLKLRGEDEEQSGGVVELRCRVAARLRFDNLIVKFRTPRESSVFDAYTLRARWRQLQDDVVWLSTASPVRLDNPKYVMLSSDAPLPLGVPLLRECAILDLEVWCNDGMVTSCEVDGARVRRAVLDKQDSRALRFAGDGVVVEVEVSCSSRLAGLYAEIKRLESEPTTATATPAAEVLLVSLKSMDGETPMVCRASQHSTELRTVSVPALTNPAALFSSCSFVADASLPLSVELASQNQTLGRGVLGSSALRGLPKLVEIDMGGAVVTARVRPLKRLEMKIWQAHLPSRNTGTFSIRATYGGEVVATTRWSPSAEWHEHHDLLLDEEKLKEKSLLLELVDKNKVIGAVVIQKAALLNPSRCSSWALTDTSRRVVGELSMALVASASFQEECGEDLSRSLVAEVRFGELSVETDDDATNLAGVFGTDEDPPSITLGWEQPGDAHVVLATTGQGAYDDTAVTSKAKGLSFEAELITTIPINQRQRLVLRCANSRAAAATVVELSEVLRSPLEPRQLSFSLLPKLLKAEDEPLLGHHLRLKTKVEVASKATITLCGLELLAEGSSNGHQQAAAELYVDGRLVGATTRRAANKQWQWFERFDLAIPKEAGRVQVFVDVGGMRLVASLAHNSTSLVNGLHRIPVVKADDPDSPAGYLEIHVAQTDFGSDDGQASNRLENSLGDAVGALDRSAAAAAENGTRLSSNVLDALNLLRSR